MPGQHSVIEIMVFIQRLTYFTCLPFICSHVAVLFLRGTPRVMKTAGSSYRNPDEGRTALQPPPATLTG